MNVLRKSAQIIHAIAFHHSAALLVTHVELRHCHLLFGNRQPNPIDRVQSAWLILQAPL